MTARNQPARVSAVIGWFRVAGRSPAEADVDHIAKLVDALRQDWQKRQQHSDRVREAADSVDIAKLREVQKATTALRHALPQLIAVLQSGDRGGNATISAAAKLLECVSWAAQYLGEPPPPGRHPELWHTWANALREPVSRALQRAGMTQVAFKQDSPATRILCAALGAIDGLEHEPAAVASWARRHPARGRRN